MPPPLANAARGRQSSGPEPRIHYIVFRAFEGMDTQSNRVGQAPTKLAWLENLQPIGTNDLIQVPGPTASITTIAGQTVSKTFFATYGGNDYAIVFTVAGAGYQVNLAGGGQVQFAPPGTFTNPDCVQFASDRILIADPSASYCTWDGTVFVKSGGVSPNIVVTNGGSGYTSVPSVTISGGSGGGATAVATVVNNIVVSVQLTAAGSGYKAGDVLTVTFGGPGINAAATAIVWPILTFPNLSTLAVFQGRVWIAGNRTLFWTGTKGFDDANAANASGSSILSDSDLPHQITALRSLNNFLYIFGDGSLKQIGTIAVSGSTTLFTITTLSSDQGTTFPQSIAAYNRLVLFANFVGVFAIFGATVEKISDPMDGVFRAIDFSRLPSAVSTDINNVRVYMLLVKYNDPVLGPRSIFLSFMNRKWFVISQGSSILACLDAHVGGVSQIFTSSGNDITRVLADPTVSTSITVRTALADNNLPMQGKRTIRLGVAQSSSVIGTMTVTSDSENSSNSSTYQFSLPVNWINNTGGVITWLNNSSGLVTFSGPGFLFQDVQLGNSGIYLGCSLMGTFSGFHLNNIVLEYEDAAVMRSRNHP